MDNETFKELIWQKGRELFRPMPWRDNTDPYFVLVSELMLQQTQVDRVIPKFEAFIAAFPTIVDLAMAPLSTVLQLWSGLGYNRRAKFLHEAAKKVVIEYGGNVPGTAAELISLPGVGKNTAAAILNYSFNVPTAFVETNIRTVYFYHFFQGGDIVTDAELLELVEATIDAEHPREWFWAIMDYGTFLKKNGFSGLTQSKHYKKQSALKGSLRETRGLILKHLTQKSWDEAALRREIAMDERFFVALKALENELLVVRLGHELHLAD